MAKTENSADEKQEKKPEGQAQDKATDRAARKKRGRKNIAEGVVHIHSTFNNTIVTITDCAVCRFSCVVRARDENRRCARFSLRVSTSA